MEIDEAVRPWLIDEIRALLALLQDPDRRACYTALLSAVEEGEVPDSQMEALGALLELGLQSGRFRQRYGPYGEAALIRLYHQTPAGASIVRATQEANQALETLRGQVIESIHFTPRGPGHYRLVIETDRCRLALETGQEGVWIRDVGIGV